MFNLLVLIGILQLQLQLTEAKDGGIQLFSKGKQGKVEDKTLAMNCVTKCALRETCVGTSMLFVNNTCRYLNRDELEDMTDYQDVLYGQSYPPVKTCENEGIWGNTSKTYCNCTGNYTGTYCERFITDCSEGFEHGKVWSGVYTIQPRQSPVPFQVYCEMKWGGRTYIQKQQKGVDFYRSWQEYRDGYGSPAGDYWVGLQKIKEICDGGTNRLIVNVQYPSKPKWRQGFFHDFSLTSEADGFMMTFSDMTTTSKKSNQISDAMSELKGARFSTYDRDNDDDPKGSCAERLHSGWWFKNCTPCNPNGRLKPVPVNITGDSAEIFWKGDIRGVTGVYMALGTE